MNLDEIIKKYVNEQMDTYRAFSGKTHELLSDFLSQKGIVPHSITNRVKDPEKLKDKIARETKNYDNPLNEITDLAGVRIITYFPTDVDKILPVIKEQFKVDQKNSEDKRHSEDPAIFGYASVHFVTEFIPERLKLQEYRRFKGMKCEIQVRTILQHAWAEIEHDILYKSTEDIPFQLRRGFASLAGLLEIADREFEYLRQYEKGVRETIKSRIRKGDLKIPVDLDSISFYLEKYHQEVNLESVRVSALIQLIKSMTISTVDEFNKILSAANLEKIDWAIRGGGDIYLSRIIPLALKKGEGYDLYPCLHLFGMHSQCLLRYHIAIGLHYNLSSEEIFKFIKCPRSEEILKELTK